LRDFLEAFGLVKIKASLLGEIESYGHGFPQLEPRLRTVVREIRANGGEVSTQLDLELISVFGK
jgi:hypothetical protein